MPRSLTLLALALLTLAGAPLAAADGTTEGGCLKFDPETMLPYYDVNCGRADPAPGEETSDAPDA